MTIESYTIYDLGYNQSISKVDSFYDEIARMANIVENGVNPVSLYSGDMSGNFDLVYGHLQSSNFVTGSTGWQITAEGVLECSDAIVRGEITATSGIFGSWTISGDSFSTTANNMLVGSDAGQAITTGTNNTFIGYQAGYSNTTGSNCVNIGYQAGYSNLGNWQNVFIGYKAGYSDAFESGTSVFIGYKAGYANDGGKGVFIGNVAGISNTTATFGTFIGDSAGYSNTTGGNNTYIGSSSGYTNSTGGSNVFLGYKSGYYETASNKLFIDNQTRTNEATSRTNSLIYGVFNATPTSQILQLNAAVICGTNVALATDATDGFLYIPTCAGAPTGTPTAYTGKVAIVFDTTNNKLYCYDGGWVDVT